MDVSCNPRSWFTNLSIWQRMIGCVHFRLLAPSQVSWTNDQIIQHGSWQHNRIWMPFIQLKVTAIFNLLKSTLIYIKLCMAWMMRYLHLDCRACRRIDLPSRMPIWPNHLAWRIWNCAQIAIWNYQIIPCEIHQPKRVHSGNTTQCHPLHR